MFLSNQQYISRFKSEDYNMLFLMNVYIDENTLLII